MSVGTPERLWAGVRDAYRRHRTQRHSRGGDRPRGTQRTDESTRERDNSVFEPQLFGFGGANRFGCRGVRPLPSPSRDAFPACLTGHHDPFKTELPVDYRDEQRFLYRPYGASYTIEVVGRYLLAVEIRGINHGLTVPIQEPGRATEQLSPRPHRRSLEHFAQSQRRGKLPAPETQ